MKKKSIGTRLSEAAIEKLRRLAYEERRSQCSILEKMIEDYGEDDDDYDDGCDDDYD